jgi:hypothetical protein
LNSYPQFVTRIDGLDIHFIHVRSKNRNALPLIARFTKPYQLAPRRYSPTELRFPEVVTGLGESVLATNVLDRNACFTITAKSR